MTYISLGWFEISFSTIVSFFTGMLVGFLILLLIYLYAVLRNLNKNLRLKQAQEIDIDEEEIKWMIRDAQLEFKQKDKRKEQGAINYMYTISKELSIDISKKFFPRSKYPYLELTIDETLALSHYVTDRVSELLDSRILSLFRGITLRQIMELNDAKTTIENTKVVKAVKKYNITTAIKAAGRILNVFNPFYWFKKLTINQVMNVVLVKIGMAVIAITGEETYKIYSKKVFNEEREIKTNVEDIYDEISKALEKEAKEHEKKED